MNYPGNPAISPEVQQRIRSTFEQTLGLAERGSRQEAALGCDFILQLDPQFRPAHTLLDRLKSSDGSLEVEDLRAELAGRASRAEREAEAAQLFDPDTDPDLSASGGTGQGGGFAAGDFDLDAELPDLGELPDLPELAAPETSPSGATGGDGDLRRAFEEGLARRRLDHVLELAQRHADRLQADPELARLASLAADRREAGPYVERFLASARKARSEGRVDEAEALEEKARSLDPTHPDLPGGPTAGADHRPGTRPGSPAAGSAAASPGEDFTLDLPDLGGDLPELPELEEPAAAASPAPFDAGDFDLGAGDDEGERRIRELLQEGQAAADRGDFQGAIDAWSRIFLIDIDHQEASDRIETARRLKSEQERKVEETYQDALRAAERGEGDSAREGLAEVLRLAPTHAAAAEQLDRLDSGQGLRAAPPPPAPAGTAGGAVPPAPAPGPSPLSPPSEADLKEEILVPPEPGSEHDAGDAAPSRRRTLVATRRTPRRFLYIGAAVFLVVLIGGYLLYANRDSLFPNAEPEPIQVSQLDPIDRATRLHESGKVDMAVNLLRQLPPSAPQYEEAQALISQWEAAETPESDAAEEPAAGEEPPEERQGALLEQAAAAAAAGENLRAAALLDQAEALGALPPGSEALRTQVDDAVSPLRPQMELLEMGEYARAIPALWRQHQEDPGNPDLRHLLTSSYYNLAVRSLQQGDTEVAVEHLQEALTLSPDDEELQRQLDFARTYRSREKDLLYRIYVKYLPAR